MSILIKLRDIRNIPEAEAQVRKYILANSKDILNYTVYDLARESYTSPATVIRLCKRLDIKGFSKLKLLIAEELKYFENMQLELLDSTIVEKNDEPNIIVEKITNIAVKTIEETRVLVDVETLVQVANILLKSFIIDFYGVGASNIVAMDATYKFMRIGKNVASYQLYDRQYVQAVNSDSNHVGVIFSYSGETKEMLTIADILQKNGTTVVSITSSTVNSLNRIADYSLFVSARETIFRSGAMGSRTAQLYIVDLLYALCYSLDYDHSVNKINQTRISYKENSNS